MSGEKKAVPWAAVGLLAALALGLVVLGAWALASAYDWVTRSSAQGAAWTMQERIQEQVFYARDPRTGLCFAVRSSRSVSIAHVPCSPEVLRLVPPERRGAP